MKTLLIILILLFSSFTYADRAIKCERGNGVIMKIGEEAFLRVKHLNYLGSLVANKLDRDGGYLMFFNTSGTEATLTVAHKHIILKIEDKEEKCQLI